MLQLARRPFASGKKDGFQKRYGNCQHVIQGSTLASGKPLAIIFLTRDFVTLNFPSAWILTLQKKSVVARRFEIPGGVAVHEQCLVAARIPSPAFLHV